MLTTSDGRRLADIRSEMDARRIVHTLGITQLRGPYSWENWVGRTARCPLGGSFSVRPPAEPDWPVSEHPALQ